MSDASLAETHSEAAVAKAIHEAVDCLDSELHDEAILACEAALKHHPACAEALFLLGLVTIDLDQPIQALKLLEKAHEIDPTVQEFAEALAATYARLGKVTDGLFHAKVATTLAPHPTIRGLLPTRFGSFFKNLETATRHDYRARAERKLAAGSVGEAIADCETQLELTPGDVPSLRILARACRRNGDIERAVAASHAVLHGAAAQAEDISDLARALSDGGRHDEAAACHRAAAGLAPDRADLQSRMLSDLLRDADARADELVSAHRAWQSRHGAAHEPRSLSPAPGDDPARPLRVAYLCGAFRDNDLMRLFAPVLEAHCRERVRAYCYADGTAADGTTDRLMRAADKWTEITGIDDETVWQILRGDEIDIAVDLSGHHEGGRPLVFARRAAPVTVSWLGYPHPPGIAAVDYFMTDPVAWPEDRPEPDTGEALWRLPRTAFAHGDPGLLPPVGPPPASKAGHLTLGVAAALGQISPSTVARWSQVLRGLDGARLLICNPFDQDRAGIGRCLELFGHMGLRDRVDIVNMTENFRSAFEFYHHVDLVLDPPAGAVAESCRALWMGVPVITLAGERHDARLIASMLTGAGRTEWIAEDPAEATTIIRRLAADIGALAALRTALRDQVNRSALADVAGFSQVLEQAYRDMWQTRAAGG